MSAAGRLRFGTFEFDPAAGELRQKGDLVKLAPQPLKVLELLVGKAGDVVTRNEVRDRVWAGDTFVDFEQGLNFCIRQIREALGDTADAPRFIETLPRRGYRFLMPVRRAETAQAKVATRLIVLPFKMLRPDTDTDFLAFSLPDAVTGSLSGLQSLVVRSSMAAARYADEAGADPKKVAAETDVDMIVTGTLLRAGDQVRVTSQLTDASTGTLLWSDTAQAPVGDVFRVQDELARRIVASLSLPLSARETQLLNRDVPASPRAYEYYLRGNQLSYDSKQWAVARDLYLRCVEDDPQFAPAWARLGRIHHVMGKYLPTGASESLDLAEAAFRKALELNPDLSLAHKLYAQVEVDRGLAKDAMARLIVRAQTADPELLAALVTTCRYCGLLDASVAANGRAVALEPRIRTSVPHTWYLQGDYERVTTIKPSEFPYIVPLSMAELGRGPEAITALCELEQRIPTKVRHFISAARALLEGKRDESIAEMKAADIRDPEAFHYAARHLSHLTDTEGAIAMLERSVAGGFFCYPSMARDPWFDPLRKEPAFMKVLKKAETQHQEAAAVFSELHGEKALDLTALPI
jgi:DNA-binding winged helix-turn-helix (wHTH) protein/tetratricopeptide (TPR) repeat protein